MTRAKPSPPQAGLTRKHLARAERERGLQRWLIGSVTAILAVVAGLIGYPIVDQQLFQPGQPVAIVGGVEISTRDFQQRVRYSRVQLINQYWRLQEFAQYFGDSQQFQAQIGEAQGLLNSTFGLGSDVLDQMIEEELIRQEASRRSIGVSSQEVDAEIREAFGYFPDGTPTPEPTRTPTLTPTIAPTRTGQPTATSTAPPSLTPTPEHSPTPAPTETPTAGPTVTATAIPSITPTPTAYTAELFARDRRDLYVRLDRQTGMSETEVRRIFEAPLLRTQLLEVWEATPQVESVHARHILVADEPTAQEVMEKLHAGEDFAALAAQYSTDSTNKDQGGDLGFFSRNEMVTEFDQAAFANPIGLIPKPVQTTFGWHIIEVLEKQAESAEQARERALTEWLAAQRDDTTVVTTFDYWEQRVPEQPPFDPGRPPTPFPTSAP